MELKEQQEPLSVEDQIKNLKSLGLIIEDEDLAASFLNDVSYFRFIKAYSLGLKRKNSNYHSGVSFNQLMELYLFNSNLRQLMFAQIEHIEVNLRCRVANHFSLTYGVLGYLDEANFADKAYHSAFMKEIKSEIKRNKRAPFIRNFRENYVDGQVPLYALVEIFSFGTLSKLLKNMKSPDKKAIASTFDIRYPYLESWIESLAYVRNLCAHYGRLYNVKLTKTPRLFSEDKRKGIGNNRIFGVIICMKHLLDSDKGWDSFVDSLEKLFIKYPHVRKESMGFPSNWKDLLSPASVDSTNDSKQE